MAFVHLTKSAATSTGRPHQQKSRRLIGIALPPIRTAPLLTNGMDLPLLDHLLHRRKLTGFTNWSAQPARQGNNVRPRARRHWRIRRSRHRALTVLGTSSLPAQLKSSHLIVHRLYFLFSSVHSSPDLGNFKLSVCCETSLCLKARRTPIFSSCQLRSPLWPVIKF